MSTVTLKDSHFSIIGYIESAPDGRQTGKDAHFSIVGYYDPRMNVTKDAHFSVVGYGNLLGSLIGCK